MITKLDGLVEAPAPKPAWHSAKVGEVWELKVESYGFNGKRIAKVSERGFEYDHGGWDQLTGHIIKSGRRIWPKSE